MSVLKGGFSSLTAIGSDNGPFTVIAEDKDGQPVKVELAELNNVVTITATDAITAAEHAGRVNLLGEVGGDALVTLTLPAATGSGDRYRFIVSVVNTSNYVIQVADASHTLEGVIMGTQDLADTVVGWESGATDDTVTLNGTTTGGAAIGDWLEFVDMGSNLWHTTGLITQTGIEATPFSAAVS
jgi:hypothetical protein